MLYYRSEARESAIEDIRECITKISEVPGDKLSYIDSTKITRYLSMLIDEIEREERNSRRK